MRINNAEHHMLYLQPARFIEKHVLPLNTVCTNCDASLTLDMAIDLRAHDNGEKWVLAYDCPVCHKTGKIVKKDYWNASDKERKSSLYKHYDSVVDYYLSLYPSYYVWMHKDEEGSLKFIVHAIYVFLLPIIAGIFGDATNSYLVGWSVFLLLLTALGVSVYYCLSPRRHEVIKQKLHLKRELPYVTETPDRLDHELRGSLPDGSGAREGIFEGRSEKVRSTF